MHSFAQKPKATGKAASTDAALRGPAYQGPRLQAHSIARLQCSIGNPAVQRLPQSGAGERVAVLTEPASPRFAYDLLRIPVHPPAAAALQKKHAIHEPGCSEGQDAERIAVSAMAATEDRHIDGGPRRIQRKPTISTPGDSYEREADEVADRVMRTADRAVVRPAPTAIQRKCADCEEEQKKRIQAKQMPSAGAGGALDAGVAASAATRGGSPLSTDLRAWFEPRFGQDFSQVRVHTDGEASNAARSVQARAYTYGSDIVFGAGEYAPSTAQGRRLLAHELTHVIQQGGAGALTHGGPSTLSRVPSGQGDSPTREDAGGGNSCETAAAEIDSQANLPGNTNVSPTSPTLRSDPAVFRSACAPAACPPVEFPAPAYGVIWQEAERCLQDRYKEENPGNTIGFATSWVGLTGKNPHEQATIDYFRSHYTGKGFKPKKDPQNQFPDSELEREGSGQRQAEPDIFDFTKQVILEITTPAGVPYRAQKIVWEVDEATKLMLASGIGGKQQWAPGFWQPKPCYTMPGSGGKGYYRAWNQGGVLTYMPVSDVTNEAYLAALAAAVAAAGKAMSKGSKGSGPPPVVSPAPSHAVAYALLVVAALALAVLLGFGWVSIGAALVRVAAVLVALLEGASLAWGAEGGSGGAGSGSGGGAGGQPGGTEKTGTADGPGGTGGAGGAGGTKAGGSATGSGSGPAAAQQSSQQNAGGGKTPAPSGTTGSGSAPYNETLRKLMEAVKQLNLKDGDKITPEDAERILALGEELLKQLEAADPNDPNAVALKDLTAGMKPNVDKALKKLQSGSGTGDDKKGGGTKAADKPGSGSKDTQTPGSGTKDHDTTAQNANPGTRPSTSPKPKGDDGSTGKGGAGKDSGMRTDPSAISGSGLKPVSDEEAGEFKFQAFQFGISGFDPTVSRKPGDPVHFTINGVVKGKGFHAEVTGTFDHAETSGGTIITFVELPSVLVVEGTDPPQAIDKHVKLITTRKK